MVVVVVVDDGRVVLLEVVLFDVLVGVLVRVVVLVVDERVLVVVDLVLIVVDFVVVVVDFVVDFNVLLRAQLQIRSIVYLSHANCAECHAIIQYILGNHRTYVVVVVRRVVVVVVDQRSPPPLSASTANIRKLNRQNSREYSILS